MRLPEGLFRGLADKLELLEGVIDGDFAETISADPYKELLGALNAREQISGREPVQQILYLWMKTVFVNYVLAGERMDMAHSVEVRLPFLDHKLFELTREIPTEVHARGGQQKWLLREAARPVVTDEVYRGVKHGFMAPPSTLMPGSRLHQLIQDTLRSQSMARLPFFDEAAVKKLLDRMAAGSPAANASLDPLLMMMTSLCILQDRYAL
ncbi:MAG: hypothetical protein HKN73_21040 [Gemmatimonadetes bacterium]|nr:hypothetical protein [Gemmatimonadota bacterium]